MTRSSREKTLRIAKLGMLIALIFIMQYIGTLVSKPLTAAFGIELSFVLIPIVIGAFLLGPLEGAILGLTFGIMTVVMTVMVPNTMTYILFYERPIVFTVLALTKAVGAGLGSALAYKGLGKLFSGKFVYLQTVLASASAPIINTGIFVLGMGFFSEAISKRWSGGQNVFLFIIGLIWINFLIELGINIILTPAIERIINIVGKKAKKKTDAEALACETTAEEEKLGGEQSENNSSDKNNLENN